MSPRFILIVLSFIFAPLFAAAAEPAKGSGKPLTSAEAKQHIGEVVTVVGHIDGVKTTNSGLVLMNMDGHFPHQTLTLVVRPKDVAAVGDVNGFAGKTVKVTGRVTEFHDAPQIEIAEKSAIEEVPATK